MSQKTTTKNSSKHTNLFVSSYNNWLSVYIVSNLVYNYYSIINYGLQSYKKNLNTPTELTTLNLKSYTQLQTQHSHLLFPQ